MGFEALIEKVEQAEAALEAQERRAAADWRQLRLSWRELWTPGRIVLAGLASGFLSGQARAFRFTGGGGALQLLTALSGLFAAEGAQAAANEASDAADDVAQDDAAPAASAPRASQDPSHEDTQRRYREAGLP